jgi:hypothetical protein
MKIQLQQILLLLLFMGIAHSTLSAQTKKEKKDNDKYVHIDMKDGTVVEGTLMGRLGDTVVVESKTLGIVSLNIKNIKHIEDTKKEYLKNGEYIPMGNIYAPYSFFAPTGFGLRKGEGYYSNFDIFISKVGYGFTDYFSIEAGTEMLSLLIGKPFQVVYAVPKLSFPIAPDINLGLGVYVSRFGSGITFDDPLFVNVPFGIATFGNRDKNISVGFGTLLISGDKSSFLSISGQLKVSKKISLITENYILRSGVVPIPIISVGMRYAHRDFSFDAGLAALGIPFLGFSVPFGQPR